MHIATLITEGACLVNGVAAHGGQRLSVGDEVEFACDEAAQTAMTPEPLPLEIVYEDAQMLVVVKPAGMLMHPTRGVKSGTLANALAYHLNRERIESQSAPDAAAKETDAPAHPPAASFVAVRPGLVHRLDRATSGLVVVAKTDSALSARARHTHERRIEKRYLATLDGCVAANEELISAPIGRDPAAHPKWRVMADGKPSASHLRVLARRATCTLVEFTPLTGRTNQLRIHSSHIGHPITGDEWYGRTNAAATAARLCLHASRLAFHHPANGAWMEFESPSPVEMQRVWDDC